MDAFSKRELKPENISEEDRGIHINKLLTLIEDSEYFNNILEYFDITKENDDFIEINGATTLFTIINSLNNKYKKIDLSSNLNDITFTYTNGFAINFNNLTTDTYFDDLGKTAISAYPVHSGERDFFSNLYEINKYAKRLLAHGYNDILDQNLALLKTKEPHNRRYRLLHDIKTDEFYLRAIISEDRYFNYDNSITLVIALLKLHTEMKASNVKYEIYSSEFNESFIRIYFKTNELKELPGVGELGNTIQVSNDEIKREALKFSNVCSIYFKDSKNEEQQIFIKPKDVKTKILSITHGTGPDKAFQYLEDFNKGHDTFNDLYEEVKKIIKIKDHNQIVHLVRSKIEKSTTEEIKRYKEELRKQLLIDIKTTTQLLETFNKLIHLEGLEIDAKEYLRYLLYDALLNRE